MKKYAPAATTIVTRPSYKAYTCQYRRVCRSWVQNIKTHQNENPAPAVGPDDATHEADSLKTEVKLYLSHRVMGVATHISKNATERARQSCCTEEQGDTKLSFASLIPHGKVVDDAGKEARLGCVNY